MMFGSRTTLGSAARAPSPNADTVRWELLGMGCSDSIVRCCCVLCLPCGKRPVAGLPCGTASVDFVFHREEPKRWPRLSLYQWLRRCAYNLGLGFCWSATRTFRLAPSGDGLVPTGGVLRRFAGCVCCLLLRLFGHRSVKFALGGCWRNAALL